MSAASGVGTQTPPCGSRAPALSHQVLQPLSVFSWPWSLSLSCSGGDRCLSPDFLLSGSCAISSGEVASPLGAGLSLLWLLKVLSSQDLTPGSVEEAEEAEPDEEFKDAIEVGGLSQHPQLTRSEVGWSWSHVASHIPSLGF